MLNTLTSALATDGLMWIAFGTFLAGVVRGFSGFGTAMIYLPIAGQFLSPIEALITLTILDSTGPIPALPRSAREADWPDLRRLSLAMIICLPFGLLILLSVPEEVFRYAVSLISLGLLCALIFGLRYQGRLSRNKVLGVGAFSGILGGSAGLPGPAVILFYMASTHPPHVIRATIMLFLFSFDVALMVILSVQGLLTLQAVAIGVVLIVPMICGVVIGTWLFRPSYEKVYRTAAYVIIGVSAVRGLPIWG
ncbi:sulfite exporter TauE/SafE family protein [Planktotalea sp.]|uniref:sulfite exporter TauE/SafE family protein n=1 Tax=Planktotalea sp. TaxID=2029877 RepID=UPI003299D197